MSLLETLQGLINAWPAVALGVGGYVGVRVDLARLHERVGQALSEAGKARDEARQALLATKALERA